MNKNEIWEKIKNDKTIIYNQSILDVFLQTTDELNLDHYLELNDKQKEFIYKKRELLTDLLYTCIEKNKTQVFEFLLNKFYEVTKNKIRSSNQLLFAASKNGKWDIAELIIQKILQYEKQEVHDPYYPDDDLQEFINRGLSSVALSRFKNKKQEELADLLISKGARKQPALEDAIASGNVDSIDLLINKGARLDSAFILSAQRGKHLAVKFILDNKDVADLIDEAFKKTLLSIEEERSSPWNPHTNLLNNYELIINMLMQKGADVKSAFLWAIQRESIFIVKFLINYIKDLKEILKSLPNPRPYSPAETIKEIIENEQKLRENK